MSSDYAILNWGELPYNNTAYLSDTVNTYHCTGSGFDSDLTHKHFNRKLIVSYLHIYNVFMEWNRWCSRTGRYNNGRFLFGQIRFQSVVGSGPGWLPFFCWCRPFIAQGVIRSHQGVSCKQTMTNEYLEPPEARQGQKYYRCPILQHDRVIVPLFLYVYTETSKNSIFCSDTKAGMWYVLNIYWRYLMY